ncbi:hypothetical protein BCR33DRAFT_358093 [Rhizoclosmatium globosum]|uniref:Uncharacterized protein n=1 Tax=Rhizoclosmatium globosum TaxID=329046 RepID=A0A1Y2C161_9FUNG|nr:hypothetical protein BCR33DRAFT_358093 [Rhizoclosmatium globosum]|eukprot:ORY40751.1 hypothetical protein BCR33DRAFT_358093 [Rhizoclosmatium globosum]
MELLSELAHCLVEHEQLTTEPNHSDKADNPRILRHQIKRPAGPRSEPVTAMHSPLTYSKSPSPSAPPPLRRSNTIVQPYIERPCTPSPQAKQLANRASPSSLYSSMPYSEHNTPPRAAHYNPSIATTLDEDETIYTKTAGGFYNMHDNPRRGSLDTACHSIKTATSHLDHVEMYQQFHPEQTTPRALTTHAQTPDIQFSSHPSKKMFASTVIQPLAAVSGTSSHIKATTSPQTMSIVSSPAMSMMSSSLITPGSTIRPTPTPSKSNDRFSVTSETYASSERTTNEESLIPNGGTKGMKEKMMGPRPLVPARTKFRQNSEPAPAPTVGVLEGSNLKRGITLGSGENGRRFGRKERVVEELEEEEGGIVLGHISKSVSTLRKQQVPASIQPAAEATKKEKGEDVLSIGAFELVASGSVIAVVSDKVAAPIPDVQQNQLLLSEIKSFGYESLRKRMTSRKKNAANPVSGTSSHLPQNLLTLIPKLLRPPQPQPPTQKSSSKSTRSSPRKLDTASRCLATGSANGNPTPSISQITLHDNHGSTTLRKTL